MTVSFRPFSGVSTMAFPQGCWFCRASVVTENSTCPGGNRGQSVLPGRARQWDSLLLSGVSACRLMDGDFCHGWALLPTKTKLSISGATRAVLSLKGDSILGTLFLYTTVLSVTSPTAVQQTAVLHAHNSCYHINSENKV